MIGINVLCTSTMKVGYVVGVFDLFHAGHVRLIDRVLSDCDKLVVGVHTDEFVKAYKRRPVNSQTERQQAILTHYGAKLQAVEVVGGRHKDLIDRNSVTHMYHGDDWEIEGYKKQIRYAEDDLGVEIVIVPYTAGISTTKLTKQLSALKPVRTVFFDLDNTLVLDGKATDGAPECVTFLKNLGIDVFVITNNNKYAPTEISSHLCSCGIQIDASKVISSLTEVRDYLDNESIVNAFFWGSAESKSFLGDRVTDDISRANLIVLGYNDSFDYGDLVKLVTAVSRGTPYMVANIDPLYPSSDTILPDTGSIAAMVLGTTGKHPTRTFGKPHMELPMQNARDTYLMVGDKESTDGKLAEVNGIEFFHITDLTNMKTLLALMRAV